MKFPRKFKNLLEIELKDVDSPDEAWLTYAVCALKNDSCGWGGWMLEAALKRPNSDGSFTAISASDEQICPRCGRQTFRTGATLKFVQSSDQTDPSGVPCVDYEVTTIEYDEDSITPLRELIAQEVNEQWNEKLDSFEILGFIFWIPAVLLIVSKGFFEIPTWAIVASVIYALTPVLLGRYKKSQMKRSNKEDAPGLKPAR